MVQKVFVLFALFLALPKSILTITTTHHDKTEKPKRTLEFMDKNISSNDSSERHRRLIPYINFYLTNNNVPQTQNPYSQTHQYQPAQHKIPQTIYQDKFIISNYQPNNNKFTEAPPTQIIFRPKPSYTPFLDSNKLPGGFTPIFRGTVQVPQNNYQTIQEPNFSAIFDKLLQIKQLQKAPQFGYQGATKLNIASQYFRPQPTKFIPVNEYQLNEDEPQYKPVETGYKQVEQSYKPIEPTYKPIENNYKPIPSHVKTIIHTYTPSSIEIPVQDKVPTYEKVQPNYENYDTLKVYNQIAPLPKPTDGFKPILVQEIQPNPEKNYDTYILRPIPKPETNFPKYRPIYRPVYAPLPKPKPTQPTFVPPPQPAENPNSLSVILKQLQDSNTLPHTLTPDNIDNSIKTLVKILNSLKHTKLQKPIIVDDISDEDAPENAAPIHSEEITIQPENESIPHQNEAIDDFNQLNTPEGGTPGKPGEDYPAYSSIPQTNFNCKTQRYKGFFGDPETNCQVWHYCDLNGGQASFLCPNGTIFSQVALTCDWWYNVKCATTTQLYVLNERLYKYILPFTPKFPEDYSGPLVDKYLALKFKEMEEKMRKQKTKGKVPKPEDDTREGDVDKLQIIEAETITKPLQTPPTEDIRQRDEEISGSDEK